VAVFLEAKGHLRKRERSEPVAASKRDDVNMEHSLDELSRALAEDTIPRRKALRMVGGMLLGTALASIPGMAWAAPPEGRGPCPSPEDRRCRGVCTNVVFDRFNCGRCGNECATGEDCCGGRCVPLNTRDNCGCCGCGCLEAEICVNGSCQCPEPGQTVCANVCCPQGHCVFGGPGEPDRCVP
jgi:Stigma-specific protein, Stig1